MSIIAWIVLGAIAGYLAGFLVRGDEGLGVIGHIVLGSALRRDRADARGRPRGVRCGSRAPGDRRA